MKDCYSILHSYHYLPNKNLNLVNNNTEIHDKDGNFIIGLSNIPSNDNLYKVELKNIKKKKKSLKYKIQNYLDDIARDINYKVIIKININKLLEMINNGDSIPHRIELFKLLRRNYTNKNEKPYQDINIKKIFELSKKQNIINCNLMSYHFETIVWISERERSLFKNIINKDIVKIDKIYIDLKKEKFYTSKSNVETKINIKGGIILDSKVTSPHISLLYNLVLDNNKLNLDSNIASNKLISNNTLIITNHNNIDLWKNILDSSSLEYLIIQNKIQLTKLTYRNIISKKIIILSLNCLSHPTYLHFWTDYMSNNQTYKEALETISEERSKNRSLINSNKVIFQLIYWNRIIFDNIVSTINQKNIVLKNMIYLFDCNKKWILEENSDDYQNIFDLFLNNKNKFNKLNLADLKYLSRKTNIKIGLKNFFDINVIKVKGNDLENKYYHELNNKNDKLYFESLSCNFLKINNKKLSNIKESLDFDTIYNDNCSICLEKLDIKELGITECNHLFCYKCLLNCIKTNDKCPKCRGKINKDLIYKVVENYNDLSSKYSKLSAIIKYLKQKKNILIISLFKSSLEIIQKHISQENIYYLTINDIESMPYINDYSEIILLESLENLNPEFLETLSSKIFKNNNFFRIKLTEVVSSFTK